jgi:hypothetical protein
MSDCQRNTSAFKVTWKVGRFSFVGVIDMDGEFRREWGPPLLFSPITYKLHETDQTGQDSTTVLFTTYMYKSPHAYPINHLTPILKKSFS